MPTLLPTQISDLQAKITSGDIAGFYTDLQTYGDPYGTLGKGVTNNNTWQGALANAFAASGADDDSVDLTHGQTAWTTLNTGLANAYLEAYRQNSNSTPTWEAVQQLHNDEYAAAGLDPDDWFPNKLLNDSGDPAALWADFMSNTSSYDLMGDALTVAESGAALLFGPYLAYQALVEANGLDADKMEFAQNFLRALASIDPTLLEDMALDLVSSPIVDLVNAITDIPDALGNFLSKLPNTLADFLPNSLPGWVPGVTTPFGDALPAGSPIVLDVDMSGTIELAALNGTGSVYWDIDQDGFREASGWITGGDGLLCIDLNSDGVINDHGELFGGANGYATLDAYDTNSDNAITAADTDFSDFLVWIDTNADGYSQSGELHTLTSLNITSIATSYSNVNYQIAGNQISYESTFVMNGNTYTSVDAFFTYHNVNTEYAENFTLDLRTLFLPDLRGYGTLPDLYIAMSEDETLLEMVQALSTENLETLLDADAGIDADMRAIMHRWAGADSVDPTSRGVHIDARDLAFLEAFMGQNYSFGGNTPDPGPTQGGWLKEAFQNAFNAIAARLLFQGAASNLFDDKPVYDPHADTFSGTVSLDLDLIETLAAGMDTNATNLIQGWQQIFRILDGTIGLGNISGGDQSALTTIMQDNTGGYALTFSQFQSMVDDESTSNIFGTSGADFIVGQDTVQAIYGYAGRDVLFGGAGNDYLYGGDDGDLLFGGAGYDNPRGGAGDDDYVFSVGDGPSGTYDYLYETTGAGTDRVLLNGVDPDDVRLWTDSMRGLFVQYSATDQLYIVGSTGSNSESQVYNHVERIMFDDGTTWDLTQGLHLVDTDAQHSLYGTSLADTLDARGGSNEYLYSYGGNDTLIGGDGFEHLYGGTGDDDYVFAVGDGVSGSYDYVNESADQGTDRIILNDIEFADVRMWTVSSGHLMIKYSADDQIYVFGATVASGESTVSTKVETIVFDDLTLDLTQGLHLVDTDDVHSLYGSGSADIIDGNGGGEYIFGYGGDDILYGGSGADTLYGGIGADTFVFEAVSAYSNVDGINDFSLAQNDAIDLIELLGEYDPLTEAITDFVQITTSGASSLLSVDRDGTAATYGFTQIAHISGVTGLMDEAALVSSGHLIVT